MDPFCGPPTRKPQAYIDLLQKELGREKYDNARLSAENINLLLELQVLREWKNKAVQFLATTTEKRKKLSEAAKKNKAEVQKVRKIGGAVMEVLLISVVKFGD